MFKKILKSIAIVIALSLPSSSEAQVLQFASDTLDVGLTTWYQPIKATYKFKNVSGHPIEIIDVDPGCGCMFPTWTEGTIKAGGVGTISVTYNSEMLGRFDRTIVVIVKDEVPMFLRMRCKVVSEQVEQQVQPDVELAEDPQVAEPSAPTVLPANRPILGIPSDMLSAGKYKRGKKIKCKLMIKNEGTEMLLINGIRPVSEAIIVDNIQIGLKPGQIYTVKFQLDTWKMSSPEDRCEMVIESNDPGRQKYSVFVYCEK